MIVVVTGGRKYADQLCVFDNLDIVHSVERITLLVEGGATGADALCKSWAISRGVPRVTDKADWTRYGRAAGGIRNGVMLDRKPRLVVAFPGDAGTENCCRQANERRIPIFFAKSIRNHT